MSFLKQLFKRTQYSEENALEELSDESALLLESDQWEEIPAFIPAEKQDMELVSVIAAAIAAQNHPESQFVIKKISQRNPECFIPAIIATSLAAELSDEHQFVVKKIMKKI